MRDLLDDAAQRPGAPPKPCVSSKKWPRPPRWQRPAALHAVCTATAVIEQTALTWLLDLLGLPDDSAGAFDPFEAIVAQAHAQGAWVHVDGAFGLWAAASAAHKWLNAPYDSGLAFVRDGAARHLAARLKDQPHAAMPVRP